MKRSNTPPPVRGKRIEAKISSEDIFGGFITDTRIHPTAAQTAILYRQQDTGKRHSSESTPALQIPAGSSRDRGRDRDGTRSQSVFHGFPPLSQQCFPLTNTPLSRHPKLASAGAFYQTCSGSSAEGRHLVGHRIYVTRTCEEPFESSVTAV